MVLLKRARPDEQDPTYHQERSQGTRNSSKQDLAVNYLKGQATLVGKNTIGRYRQIHSNQGRWIGGLREAG